MYKSKTKLFELKKSDSDFPKEKIKKSEDAYNFIKRFYSDDMEIYESFFILLLNRASNTIGYAKISQGGTVGTVVDIKIVAKYCIDSLASGVIFAHNHPSGQLRPSKEDITLTQKMTQALKLIDVSVFDHIILTSENYYSFGDNGQL